LRNSVIAAVFVLNLFEHAQDAERQESDGMAFGE